jgi:hypothetical protein
MGCQSLLLHGLHRHQQRQHLLHVLQPWELLAS